MVSRSVKYPFKAPSPFSFAMPSFPIPFLLRSLTAAYRPVGTLRRRKLRIAHSRANARARSLRCSSSPPKVLRLFGDPVFAHFARTISHRTAIQFSRYTQGVAALFALQLLGNSYGTKETLFSKILLRKLNRLISCGLKGSK